MYKLITWLKNKKNYIVSFLIASSVSLVITSVAKDNRCKPNIIFFLVLFGIYIVKNHQNIDFSKNKKPIAILSLLYSVSTVIGYELLNNQALFVRTFESSLYALFYIISLCVELLGFAAMFYIFIHSLLHFLNTSNLVNSSKEPSYFSNNFFLKTWGMILVCWLPYYVVYWPGILSPDSIYEISMQLGLDALSNHHPIIHQLTIRPFLILGQLIGNLNVGIGLHCLLQMIILSSSFALSLLFVRKLKVSKYIFNALFIFFALVPFNAIYSITIWKDIMMGAFSLTSVLLLYKLNENNKEKNVKGYVLYILAFISLFLFCTLRNNGIYAFIIATPFYLILNRKKELLKKTILCTLVIVSVLVYQYIIFDVCGIKKSKSGESLSIPLQQIARVIRDSPEKITDDEYKLLETVFEDSKEIGQVYISEISDNVKNRFNDQPLKENPKLYLKLWLDLFKRCPATYLDALIAQCYGYWFPDVTVWVTTTGYDFNQINQPLRSSILSKLVTSFQLGIQVIPGFSAIYSISLYFWIFAFGFTLLVIKRRIDVFSPFIIIITLWATTLASPVFCEFRYLYGMVVTAPVFMIVCIKAKPKATVS